MISSLINLLLPFFGVDSKLNLASIKPVAVSATILVLDFRRHGFTGDPQEDEHSNLSHRISSSVSLHTQKPLGIMSLLDEESKFPRASDLTFANKLKQQLKGNPCFKDRQGFLLPSLCWRRGQHGFWCNNFKFHKFKATFSQKALHRL